MMCLAVALADPVALLCLQNRISQWSALLSTSPVCQWRDSTPSSSRWGRGPCARCPRPGGWWASPGSRQHCWLSQETGYRSDPPLPLRFWWPIMFFIPQIHLQIGNKVDGFYFWCIPNWEDEVKYRFSLICRNKTPQDDWKLFQLYMLIIVLILPSIIMTAAYSSISRKLLSLSTDTEQSLNR